MTYSQNLNWANGLMFAHTKSKPTIMLCISVLFLLCCTFNKQIHMITMCLLLSESAVYLCECTEICVNTPRENVTPAPMFKRT